MPNIIQDQGKAENGRWRLNIKDGFKRCILDCNEGYSPSGCHVIRKDSYGDRNHNIPSCVEGKFSMFNNYIIENHLFV
jgi:hypothetical protein